MSDQGFRDAFDAAMSEMDIPAADVEATDEEALQEQDAPEVEEDETEEAPAVDSGEAEEGGEQEEQPAFTWRDVSPEAWRDIDRARLEDLPEPVRRWKIERDRLAGKYGEMERKFNELQQRLPKDEPKQQEPSGPPPLPPSDADDATYQKMMDAREQWFTEQGALKAVSMLEERQRQQEQQRQAQAQQQRQQEWAQTQLNRISQKEGFTEEVAEIMSALAGDQTRPYYGAMLQSEAGIDKLYEEARSIVESNRVAVQSTTKKATARSRVTPRAAPAPKRASSEIEIPDSPDDVGGRVGAIMDAFGS